jgi:hypothetical protein
MGHAVQRFIQRLDNAAFVQHVQRTAGALYGFFPAQHIGPARCHQHQVIKTHGFHSAGGGPDIARVAGVDQYEIWFAWGIR